MVRSTRKPLFGEEAVPEMPFLFGHIPCSFRAGLWMRFMGLPLDYTVSTMMFPLVYTQMSLAICRAFFAISAAPRSVLATRARAAARA